MTSLDHIEQIVAAEVPMDAQEIREWMADASLDIRGAVYGILMKQHLCSRIHPPLQFQEVFNFVTAYYADCILRNPVSEWADSRVGACMDLGNWIVASSIQEVPRWFLVRIAEWLDKLWVQIDEIAKTSLQNFTFNTLSSDKRLQKKLLELLKTPEIRELMKGEQKSSAAAISKEWFNRQRQ